MDFDGEQYTLYAKDDSSSVWCVALFPEEAETDGYSFDVTLRTYNNSLGAEARVGVAYNFQSDDTFDLLYINVE